MVVGQRRVAFTTAALTAVPHPMDFTPLLLAGLRKGAFLVFECAHLLFEGVLPSGNSLSLLLKRLVTFVDACAPGCGRETVVTFKGMDSLAVDVPYGVSQYIDHFEDCCGLGR